MTSAATHRITLVRHGETTGQSSTRHHGVTDVPLSAGGEEQMRRVGRRLAGVRFDRVFSSALSRTRSGARLIAPGGPAPISIPELNEVNFGRWEGLTKQEIAARDPRLYERWQSDPTTFTYPDGDRRADLADRVRSGFRRVAREHPPGEWLMVLHRGVIAVLLEHLIGPERCGSLMIELASIHVVVRDDQSWRPEHLDVVDG